MFYIRYHFTMYHARVSVSRPGMHRYSVIVDSITMNRKSPHGMVARKSKMVVYFNEFVSSISFWKNTLNFAP